MKNITFTLLFIVLLQLVLAKNKARFMTQAKTRFRARTKFKVQSKFKIQSKIKSRSRKSTKFMQKTRFQTNKARFSKKSRIDILSEEEKIPQKYILNITADNLISKDSYQAVKAVPEKVETELEDRIAENKQRMMEQVDNLYRSQYDLRPADFNCNDDNMEGQLYMIDKVLDLTPEKIEEIKSKFDKTGLSQELDMQKVTINMNSQKFTISDKDNILKEIVYFDTVYPREKEIQKAIEKSKTQARSQVEQFKVKLINGTQISNTGTDSYPQFYCICLVNEPVYQNELESTYKQTLKDSYKFTSLIDVLRNKDNENTKVKKTNDFSNVHDHMYYNILTLCHEDFEYLEKWQMFMNREKFDCLLDYNRENYNSQLSQSSNMFLSGQVSQSEQQYKAEMEKQAEIERLAKIKEEEEKKKMMTSEELNKQELSKLTSELQELTQSMNQEQQYSNQEISSEMQRIRGMQSQVTDKNEQLQCLEQALQIRGEEEDEEVVKLLKEEEMNKMQTVISSTRSKMKKQYEEQIKNIKEQLDKEKNQIEQEKSSYDDLMINLIKGGLKKGDRSKCVPEKDIIIDAEGKLLNPQKLDDFMTTACSEILNQADENSMDSQGGVLDRVNQCTKKDLFCNQCCSAQFGFENLVEKSSCVYQCNERMSLAQQNKTQFTAALTSTIGKESNEQMKATVEAEIAQKTKQMSDIPPARFKQIDRNRKFMKRHR